ncbi:MAG: 2OG-Fe(II) oxygenase [Bacteroidota bacterium]
MQEKFNTLIQHFIDTKIGICNNFIKTDLANKLGIHLQELYDNNLLLAAEIGKKADQNKNENIRKDKIFWIDRKHHHPVEDEFLDMIDEFILYLNSSCFAGIYDYEFHYAWFEKGSFYKKHLDQFQSNTSRKYSFIIYLNKHWKHLDGGELKIYDVDSISIITPTNAKSVFFESSEITHEVLLSNEIRMSITGWFKVRPQE